MNRQEKLIAEIHAEFDTAQDRLLTQANLILSKPIETGHAAVESIGERLKKAGFVNTPTAKRAEVIKVQIQEEKKRVVETKEQAELIRYYQSTYPFLKFLTEQELDRICSKYNLIYAPSDRYTQEVPEKNLREIETTQKICVGDTSEEIKLFSGEIWCTHDYVELRKKLTSECKDLKDIRFKERKEIPGEYISDESRIAIGVLDSLGIEINSDQRYIWINGKIDRVKRDGIFIAAPKSHFNVKGLKKKGLGLFEIFTTEIKDPIVFRYVRGGIQVLTKWGLEANDPDLVVPKLN